jgi:hypothetical protein
MKKLFSELTWIISRLDTPSGVSAAALAAKMAKLATKVLESVMVDSQLTRELWI